MGLDENIYVFRCRCDHLAWLEIGSSITEVVIQDPRWLINLMVCYDTSGRTHCVCIKRLVSIHEDHFFPLGGEFNPILSLRFQTNKCVCFYLGRRIVFPRGKLLFCWYWYVRIGFTGLFHDSHRSSVVRHDDGQAGLDGLHMSIAEVTPRYEDGRKSADDKDGTEFRTLSDLIHKIDGPKDGNRLATCVLNVQCVIEFSNVMPHELGDFI